MGTSPSPACQLEGRILEGGWIVGALLTRNPRATGGNFCQQYKVRTPSGRQAFLKALDFQRAFASSADVSKVVERITTLFNFECELLDTCSDRHMDRVVQAIGKGTIYVDPSNPFTQVPYLIFEEADADIRAHLDTPHAASTNAWKLRALHHVATGLKQLHGANIAHQDLKPSNVLVFYIDRVLVAQSKAAVSKIADLGRASRFGHPSPYDENDWAGDPNYAPPEIRYSFILQDWGARRLACDLYMLSGLICFLFTQTTSIAALFHSLPVQFWPQTWGDTYDAVLPYLINAHSTAVDQFAQGICPELREDLVPLYERLSHPDPTKRAFPGVSMNRNVLEKYLSRLDLLASRAAAGRYENHVSRT